MASKIGKDIEISFGEDIVAERVNVYCRTMTENCEIIS